jgi:hypothetical protein
VWSKVIAKMLWKMWKRQTDMDRPIMCSLFMLKDNKHLNRVLETLPVPQVYFYHRASWHVVLTTHIPSQSCAMQSPNMSGHNDLKRYTLVLPLHTSYWGYTVQWDVTIICSQTVGGSGHDQFNIIT